MIEDPDAELLACIAGGDEVAFRSLVTRKLGRVHGLAFRTLGDAALADDVAQDAFLRVWRRAGDWRPGTARFDTWLHRVVLNLCRDLLRRRRLVFLAEPPDQIDPAIGPEMTLLQGEAVRRLQDGIRRLPRRQREAIVLQTWEELSNMEIAATMGISVKALESLLARARLALRSILEDPEA